MRLGGPRPGQRGDGGHGLQQLVFASANPRGAPRANCGQRGDFLVDNSDASSHLSQILHPPKGHVYEEGQSGRTEMRSARFTPTLSEGTLEVRDPARCFGLLGRGGVRPCKTVTRFFSFSQASPHYHQESSLPLRGTRTSLGVPGAPSVTAPVCPGSLSRHLLQGHGHADVSSDPHLQPRRPPGTADFDSRLTFPRVIIGSLGPTCPKLSLRQPLWLFLTSAKGSSVLPGTLRGPGPSFSARHTGQGDQSARRVCSSSKRAQSLNPSWQVRRSQPANASDTLAWVRSVSSGTASSPTVHFPQCPP